MADVLFNTIVTQIAEGTNLSTLVTDGQQITTYTQDTPQVQTVIEVDDSIMVSVVNAPFIQVTSINGMTGDVIVEPIILGFQPNHYYLKNSVISHNGGLYFAKQNFTSGINFDINDWDYPDFTQVKADWLETDVDSKAFILNKPTSLSQFANDTGFITESALTTIKSDISTAKTDISSLQSNLNTAQQSISSLSSDVSALDGRITTAEGKITNSESSINSLHSDVISANTKIAQNKASLDALGDLSLLNTITSSLISDFATNGASGTLGGQFWLQLGPIQIVSGRSTIASGGTSVTFAKPFRSEPVVVATIKDTNNQTAWVSSSSATNATFKQIYTTASLQVGWIAIGGTA